MASHPLRPQLQQYVQSLWFPSETEAPWTVPTWQLSTSEVVEIRQVLRRGAQTRVTEISVTDLLSQVRRRCQGYGVEGLAITQRHQALFDFLQQISDRWRVFRVGAVTVDIVVVGETDDGYVALQTQSVET